MRTATALFLVLLLLALPACRMNERMSGAAFGAVGGAVVGGALGGSFAGGVIGGLTGGVLGYLVGDYIADRRERGYPAQADSCAPSCVPTPYYNPQPQYAPPQYAPPQYSQPQYAPQSQWSPQAQPAPCAPPANYPGTTPRVGAVRSADPSVGAAQRALEAGRRARTLPEARAAYEEAVRLDPRSADAWNALGLARLSAGETEGAQEAFRQALALDPDHYAAKRNLTWATTGVR